MQYTKYRLLSFRCIGTYIKKKKMINLYQQLLFLKSIKYEKKNCKIIFKKTSTFSTDRFYHVIIP